jgi:hypothetical protein
MCLGIGSAAEDELVVSEEAACLICQTASILTDDVCFASERWSYIVRSVECELATARSLALPFAVL